MEIGDRVRTPYEQHAYIICLDADWYGVQLESPYRSGYNNSYEAWRADDLRLARCQLSREQRAWEHKTFMDKRRGRMKQSRALVAMEHFVEYMPPQEIEDALYHEAHADRYDVPVAFNVARQAAAMEMPI